MEAYIFCVYLLKEFFGEILMKRGSLVTLKLFVIYSVLLI